MFAQRTVKILPDEAAALVAFQTLISTHCKAYMYKIFLNHFIDSKGKAVYSDLH